MEVLVLVSRRGNPPPKTPMHMKQLAHRPLLFPLASCLFHKKRGGQLAQAVPKIICSNCFDLGGWCLEGFPSLLQQL